jgi:hypothetical protein
VLEEMKGGTTMEDFLVDQEEVQIVEQTTRNSRTVVTNRYLKL